MANVQDRASIERALLASSRVSDKVVAAARDLGYAGRSLKALTDTELFALYFRVWPELGLTTDESPEGRDLNARIDALKL